MWRNRCLAPICFPLKSNDSGSSNDGMLSLSSKIMRRNDKRILWPSWPKGHFLLGFSREMVDAFCLFTYLNSEKLKWATVYHLRHLISWRKMKSISPNSPRYFCVAFRVHYSVATRLTSILPWRLLHVPYWCHSYGPSDESVDWDYWNRPSLRGLFSLKTLRQLSSFCERTHTHTHAAVRLRTALAHGKCTRVRVRLLPCHHHLTLEPHPLIVHTPRPRTPYLPHLGSLMRSDRRDKANLPYLTVTSVADQWRS